MEGIVNKKFKLFVLVFLFLNQLLFVVVRCKQQMGKKKISSVKHGE